MITSPRSSVEEQDGPNVKAGGSNPSGGTWDTRNQLLSERSTRYWSTNILNRGLEGGG